MPKYLLCRPAGGLNDMLCQVERCCRYGEQFGRIVVVETDAPNSSNFRHCFSNYFTSRQSRLILNAGAFVDEFAKADVHPPHLRGRLNSYELGRDIEKNITVDRELGLPTTFDFSKDYPHPLLVHHQGGGGRMGAFALLRMTLTPPLSEELARRVVDIGLGYSAIHIRHTDLQTDYGEALVALEKSPPIRLFVATDNARVLEDFRAALPKHRICSFSSLDYPTGVPLHDVPLVGSDAFARNRDAILDLLMLALARKLYVLPVHNKPTGLYSGYAQLALDLSRTKILLRELVAGSGLAFGLE